MRAIVDELGHQEALLQMLSRPTGGCRFGEDHPRPRSSHRYRWVLLSKAQIHLGFLFVLLLYAKNRRGKRRVPYNLAD